MYFFRVLDHVDARRLRCRACFLVAVRGIAWDMVRWRRVLQRVSAHPCATTPPPPTHTHTHLKISSPSTLPIHAHDTHNVLAHRSNTQGGCVIHFSRFSRGFVVGVVEDALVLCCCVFANTSVSITARPCLLMESSLPCCCRLSCCVDSCALCSYTCTPLLRGIRCCVYVLCVCVCLGLFACHCMGLHVGHRHSLGTAGLDAPRLIPHTSTFSLPVLTHPRRRRRVCIVPLSIHTSGSRGNSDGPMLN